MAQKVGFEDDYDGEEESLSDSESAIITPQYRPDSIVPRKPFHLYVEQKGRVNFITSRYESLDYDPCENDFVAEEEEFKGFAYLARKNLAKWLMFLLIGMFTAIVAGSVDLMITFLCKNKFNLLVEYIEKYETHDQHVPVIMWICLNVFPFLLGSLMVTFIAPMAAGSGIPFVKCYLNGINVPDVLSLKTLCVKALGLAFSIVGGVASGKEGPMIHVGAAVAHIVSKGEIYLCENRITCFRYFRDDQERRDLVSAGAACGLSAAFGASVGGVLFSLEEGSSFWNQTLTWRIFFATVVSKFMLNLMLSCYYGQPGDLTHSSLINLGTFENLKYEIFEIPIFALMGVFGGISGSLWNKLNYYLAIFRITRVNNGFLKTVEAATVSALSAIIAYGMTYYLPHCGTLYAHRNAHKTKVRCTQGEGYNTMASIWLQTPQASVKSIIHDPKKTFGMASTVYILIANYCLSCVTFGMSSSNGIFVPTMLTGAAWGRVFCLTLSFIFPDSLFLNSTKYALIGAAAQLGGVVRMTLSLTVIIMETTDNISFSLPIIITLMAAKWTGDFFTLGVYDLQIRIKTMPFLYCMPPPLTHCVNAHDIMNTPVWCVKAIENVKYIIDLLNDTGHNGFPVVDTLKDSSPRYGRIRGIILKWQLEMILEQKWFRETNHMWRPQVDVDTMRDYYFKTVEISRLEFSMKELGYMVDVRQFMNTAPYTLLHTTSMPRIYRLFRAVGLRHLPIVNESNEVVGMVTRKDLATYKAVRHKFSVKLIKYNVI